MFFSNNIFAGVVNENPKLTSEIISLMAGIMDVVFATFGSVLLIYIGRKKLLLFGNQISVFVSIGLSLCLFYLNLFSQLENAYG